MSLSFVHGLLMALALIVFAAYGVLSAWRYLTGDAAALVPCLLATAGTLGVAFYLRWWRQRRIP